MHSQPSNCATCLSRTVRVMLRAILAAGHCQSPRFTRRGNRGWKKVEYLSATRAEPGTTPSSLLSTSAHPQEAPFSRTVSLHGRSRSCKSFSLPGERRPSAAGTSCSHGQRSCPRGRTRPVSSAEGRREDCLPCGAVGKDESTPARLFITHVRSVRSAAGGVVRC